MLCFKMIERHKNDTVTWLDVIHPTADEIREIFEECDLPASFADDLRSNTPRTESKAVAGALKITLDFPVVKRTDINHPHEVKFIATDKHLITVRFEDIHSVHKFGKEFEVASVLGDGEKKATGAHYFFALLQAMYGSLDSKLDYLESKTQKVEENIFNDNEKEILLEISQISRRVISFRHTLNVHESALKQLRADTETAFGNQFIPAVGKLQSTYLYLTRRVSSLGSTVEDLRDTNNALLNAKQNEVMKVLTIMAFITFPLSLFTSMFGMNTIHTPILGIAGDFWVIVGIMSFITLCFFAFFRYQRWL